MALSIIPERSPEDILSGVARVTLGGETYVLPALVWEDSDEWLAQIDGQLRGMMAALEEAGNDYSLIVTTLQGRPNDLLDALLAYDKSGVLPPRDEFRKRFTKTETLKALLGVWRAANPLVDIAIESLVGQIGGVLSELLSSPPSPTAGDRTNSDDDEPPSSLSPTPMRPMNGGPSSSRTPSKPRASAGSSPKARKATPSTNGGSGHPVPMPRKRPVAAG